MKIKLRLTVSNGIILSMASLILFKNLDMRMFFPQELDSYLEWNGFHIIHKYGGFEEEAFNDNSAKQIFVCQC